MPEDERFNRFNFIGRTRIFANKRNGAPPRKATFIQREVY